MKWTNIKGLLVVAPVLQTICTLNCLMWPKKQVVQTGESWRSELKRGSTEREGTPLGFLGVNYSTASVRNINGIAPQGAGKKKKKKTP